jgi:uncharacterized protein (TIGR03435 family)
VGDRIEVLLRRGRKFSPRASGGGTITGVLLLAAALFPALLAPHWIAFAQAEPRLAYDVASVKRNISGSDGTMHAGPPLSVGFTARNLSLRMLLEIAWQVKDSQISGGPAWINTDRFDIDAKPPDASPTAERSRAMLRTLLQERFHLTVRREIREIPVYLLVGSSGGRKLPDAQDKNCDDPRAPSRPPTAGQLPRSPCDGFITAPGFITSAKTGAAEFVDVLGNVLDRPVIDRTGIDRTFAVRLEFTPVGAAMSVDPDSSVTAKPSLAAALQEQLGLRLEQGKEPVQVLVIDHAEKPDAN